MSEAVTPAETEGSVAAATAAAAEIAAAGPAAAGFDSAIAEQLVASGVAVFADPTDEED